MLGYFSAWLQGPWEMSSVASESDGARQDLNQVWDVGSPGTSREARSRAVVLNLCVSIHQIVTIPNSSKITLMK